MNEGSHLKDYVENAIISKIELVDVNSPCAKSTRKQFKKKKKTAIQISSRESDESRESPGTIAGLAYWHIRIGMWK